MDFRLCVICRKEIDIEILGTKVFSGGRSGKRSTVIDPQGQAHIVTTRYITERHRQQTSGNAATEVKEK